MEARVKARISVTGRISILCPTRNRRDNVLRLMSSIADTAHDPMSVELVLRTDLDAADSGPTCESVSSHEGLLRQISAPRAVLSSMWNDCYENSSGEIVMQGADDIVFRTPGWDMIIRQEFDAVEDKILLAYGDDGYCRHAATHGFVHHYWPDALGYFTPPYFSCDYADTWLNDLAARVGRLKFVPDVMIEHMHPDVGKAPLDQTHEERIARGLRDGVRYEYESREAERARDAEVLRRIMA